MGIIMWLVVGGIIGWLASVIMRTDGQQGIILNIVVGIIGSFIGGLVFATVATLVFVPAVFAMIHGHRERKRARAAG